MACQVFRHSKTNEITNVVAANGKPSQLYRDIYREVKDKETALEMWKSAYNQPIKEAMLDQNGEPLAKYVLDRFGFGASYNLSKLAELYTYQSDELQRHFRFTSGLSLMSRAKAREILKWANENGKYNLLNVSMRGVNDGSRIQYVVEISEMPIQELRQKASQSEIEIQKAKVNQVVNRLAVKFPKLEIKWVKSSELKQSEHIVPVSSVNAFVKGGVVHLVEGRATESVAIEDMLHPFVESLWQDNKALFTGLFNKGREMFPELWENISKTYTNERGFTEADRKKELVTKVLQDNVQKEFEENPEKSVKELQALLQRFFNWLSKLLSEVFDTRTDGNTIVNAYSLPTKITYEELANIINTKSLVLSTAVARNKSYNLDGEMDNQELNSSKDRKLKRVDEQVGMVRKTIEQLKKRRGTDAKIQTLEKMVINLEKYRTIIENEEYTVSVTNLTGGGELENQHLYNDFKEFGTFIHFVLENIQKMSVETGKKVTTLMNRENFDMFVDSYPGQFSITNLSVDEMYAMSQEMVSSLQFFISNGYTLLPEISIVGKDRNNRNIVGRVDIMAVAPDGRVFIVDLKTKKVYSNTNIGLYFNKPYPVQTTETTDTMFSNTRRSVYDNWDTQLTVYERLFQQSDIPVEEKMVLALVYRGNMVEVTDINDAKSGFEYSGYEFVNYVSNKRQNGTEHEKLNYANVIKKVKKAIEVPGDNVEETKVTKEPIIFNMKQEDYDRLLANLESIAAEEIKKIEKALRELDDNNENDKKLKEYYKTRRESIRKIQDSFKKDTWEPAYKLTVILQFMSDNTQGMKQTAQDIANIADPVEKARKLDDLKGKAQAFNYFLSDIRELLINLNDQRNENAVKLLDNIQANIDYTVSVYNELGFNYLVEILKSSMTPENVQRLNKDREESIKPLIEHLKNKLDKLRSQQAQGGTGNSLGYSIWQGVSNIARNIAKVPIDTRNEIEALEVRIKSLELRLQGINLDDKSIRQYIQGILDKNSLYYIGSDATFVTDFVAAASNQDFGIAGFANHLKFIEVRAKQLYLNFMEKNKFQTLYDKFRKGKSDIAAINAPISEIREVTEYNSEGQPEVKRYRSFIDPVTEEYKNVFKKFWNDMRMFNKQLRETNDPDKKKEIARLKSAAAQAHRAWRLEHSQMPYVDEIYELDKFLPEEFKQKRDELYEEREAILAQVGYNEEEKLSEEDLEELAEIEIALKKLKQETIEKNSSYQEYLDKMEKYYSYEPNVFYFERIKNSKEIEYADDPVMMKKWLEMNTYKTPKQEYFDKLAELYDALYEILPKDPAVQEIRERQKSILRSYKRNGFVDTRFLSEKDIQEYEELEKWLSELKEGRGSIMQGLSEDEKDKVREIFEEINSMSATYLNPNYEKDYSERMSAVDQKFFLYNEAKRKSEAAADEDRAQLQRETEQALENFLEEEKDFEKWYNLNHYDTYESKLMGKPVNPSPKNFNYVRFPSDLENMVEIKPSMKYSIRKLKEEAFNKQYQETVDGFPMPKGMKSDNGIVKVEKSSKWVNPAYTKLTSEKDNFDFYTQFVGKFIQMQDQTYGRNLGYFFPGFEETSLQVYKEKGFTEGFKKNFEIFKQKNFSASSIFDYSVNEYSNGNDSMVRMKFNRPINLNEAEATVDGIGSVIRWYEEAFINQAVGEAQPLVSSTLSYRNNLYKQLDQSNLPDKETRKADLRKVIDSYQFEYKKIIQGITKENEGNMSKWGDTLLKGIGFTRLGFDLANQVGNYFSGNVQTFLGGHKTGQYATKNLLVAKKQVYSRNGLIESLLRDSNKFSGFTFMTKMYLYFNPTQGDLKNSFDKTRSTSQRIGQGALDAQMGFWIQDKGELEISSTIWLAMMDNRRVKLIAERNPDGTVKTYQTNSDGTVKTIPVFEAYKENTDGEVVIRDDADWTKADEQGLMQAIYSEIRRTQGNYASSDKTRVERGIMGRFLVFYRKYLMPFVLNRFGARRDNTEGAEVAMGYYNAFIRGLYYYRWKLFAGMIGKDDTVSPFYAKKAYYAVREMILASVMYILGSMLAGMVKRMDDDDDDKVLKNIAYQLLAVYIKTERETRSLVPMPIVGSIDEYINQFTDFTNFGRDITRVVKLTEHGLALGGAQVFDSEAIDKMAYYQRKTGIFDKGDAKILKDIYDVSGFMNFYEMYNPEVRVEDAFKRR